VEAGKRKRSAAYAIPFLLNPRSSKKEKLYTVPELDAARGLLTLSNIQKQSSPSENGDQFRNQTTSNAQQLRSAVIKGNVEQIHQLLLKDQTGLNAPEKNGTTPLHVAAIYGYSSVVRVLFKYGANVNAPAKNGTTPLHVAAICGNSSVVEVLLECGADVNVQAKNGTTPLQAAIVTQATRGETPPHDTYPENHLKITELLKERGGED
jgi:ankyrin repeat protein